MRNEVSEKNEKRERQEETDKERSLQRAKEIKSKGRNG